MLKRIPPFLLVLLIGIDQLAQTIIWGTVYVLFNGPKPSPDETISSHVGRKALDGRRWAIIAQYFIDGLFGLLGQKNHCYYSIEVLDTKKYPEV